MKNFVITFIIFINLISLTSCAAGSATAGYAIRAQTASGLTAEAETRVVERAKKEMYMEMNLTSPCTNAISAP